MVPHKRTSIFILQALHHIALLLKGMYFSSWKEGDLALLNANSL